MEDVNHEIYGGLYDQKIIGESFEEPASGVNYKDWKKCGGYWSADRDYSDSSVSIVPGRHTRRMIADNELDVEPDASAKLIYEAAEMHDGVVNASARLLQEKGDGAGILLRVSAAGIGENSLIGYEIRLSRQGTKIRLIKHHNDFQLLCDKSVSFQTDHWNDLHVYLEANHIMVYLNQLSEPVIDYTDTETPILKGKIGICTAGSPVSFKDISLSQESNSIHPSLTYPADQKISDRWDMIASDLLQVKFTLPQRQALNGLAAQCVELLSERGKAGVANRSLNRWGVSTEKGQSFTGSCYLHTQQGAVPVTVALESADGIKTYAKQVIYVSDTVWKKYTFTLTTTTTDSNARFAIYFEQKGKLYVDQVTLATTGAKQFRGLQIRADVGNALVSEGLTFMRYAGSMVNANGYRFKKMIGSKERRPPYTGHWNEYSSNGFGIEEFLQFAEAANFTAAFAINIEETTQDASDMVEYLNGDTTTVWGKKRAENGHYKPYGVKYLEIGNEEVLFEGDNAKAYDHYIERFLDLHQAIHAKDTSVKLVCSAWWRPKSPYVEKVFKALDGKAAYWDYHIGGDDPTSGQSVGKELMRMKSLFRKWNPTTPMKCAIFEENGSLHNMQRALGHATNLNAVIRHGDFVLTSCPANALQPYLQNDNGWDQGQIFFTPTTVWGMPPFYVQQMASANYLPLRLKDSIQGNLDVTATRSKDGKIIVLHIVNTDSVIQAAAITLNHFESRKKEAQVWSLAGGVKDLYPEKAPDAIVPKQSTIMIADEGVISYRFAPKSYTIIRFTR